MGWASRYHSSIRRAAVILWAGLVLSGFFALERYARLPGDVREPPGRWPTDCPMAHDPNRPTVLCFLHPHCPCSRATVTELARLLTSCPSRLTVHVFLWAPAGADEGWARGAIADSIAAIDGVTASVDSGGGETARWGATTSGQVLLFDSDGTLLFSGGLTESRGQTGAGAGGAAVLAGVYSGRRAASSPVYGCPLHD